MLAFSAMRHAPINVLLIEAKRPLVQFGGCRLDELREDVFDAAVATFARVNGCVGGIAAHDIVLSGGDPYAIWR